MRCSKPSQRSFIRSRIWVLASGSCMSKRMRKPCWNAGWMERRRTTRGSPDNPRVASVRRNTDEKDSMKEFSSRREFLRAAALTGAGLALSNRLVGASNKSVLVFTKSSGFEHAVVKRVDGKPSIMDDAVTDLGNKHGFEVSVTKDGRIFDSKEFHSYAGMMFFTTGDLTTFGTDGKPPMSPGGKQALLDAVRNGMGFVGAYETCRSLRALPQIPFHSLPMSPGGKQALLDAVRNGMGFVGVHAASDTFHTLPDPE